MTAYAVHRTSKADLWGKPMLDVLNREMLTLAAMMLVTGAAGGLRARFTLAQLLPFAFAFEFGISELIEL